jgi:hypothetical protein
MAISMGWIRMPQKDSEASAKGDGNFSASRPQTFSATFLNIIPKAMVAIIQPASDLVLIA